MAALATTPQ
jgi:hypothetical protein